MARRELRLAVVIYGGASLAVYMHGVTKELLKLVRASKVLHEPGWDSAGQSFAAGPDQRPHDSEAVYFDLLRRINNQTHTRVVIDVIAGASAGAINGVLLAKALVDDASLDTHTELWLTSADADELRGERVSRTRKWYLYPLLRALSLWLPKSITADDEIRGKLTRLVRTSWFRAPFSGAKLCDRLLTALDDMQRSRRPQSTLLPPEQRLDVYASITDLFGYPRLIQVHDRLVAREREHAAFVRLSHAPAGRRGYSDFSDRNAPALVWAARASSSYAGAFAPFRHRELMAVLADRQRAWPGEKRFLQRNVFDASGQPASATLEPSLRTYVDGGIVNNKPFGAALDALQHRPADRQVERVLLYVEPDPNVEDAASTDQALGYLGTIRAAVSTIPRNQPILSDLEMIMGQAERARTNRRIVDAHRQAIHQQVEDLMPPGTLVGADLQTLSDARAAVYERVAAQMGLAYEAYLSRRRWRLIEALAEEWAVLTQGMDEPQQRRAMIQSIESAEAATASAAGWGEAAAADRFLARFDLSLRIRRVQFLIRRVNQAHSQGSMQDSTHAAFDDYKRRAYAILEDLHELRSARALKAPLARSLMRAASALPLSVPDAQGLLDALAEALQLEAFDTRTDQLIAELCQTLTDPAVVRLQVLENLSFAFYDVLLMPPGAEEGGPDPLTELKVERVSPADAKTLAPIFRGLKCRNFMGFLGFFNRSFREHDYLWGRLNAAERIVDLLEGLAGPDMAVTGGALADRDAAGVVSAVQRRALLRTIIESERRPLRQSRAELERISGFLDRDAQGGTVTDGRR